MTSPCVLITGCSSGIGAALAREFHARGAVVYATARRTESLAALAQAGLRTLALDVNDDTSIAAALDVVRQEQGCLHLLVNNAGFSQVGAVLDLEREHLRRQFETNVIAPMAVTRAALPLLLAARERPATGMPHPTVANVGSIVGLFTTPFAGAYCSSKAALHALTDALRMEAAPLGVQVVTIQPGGGAVELRRPRHRSPASAARLALPQRGSRHSCPRPGRSGRGNTGRGVRAAGGGRPTRIASARRGARRQRQHPVSVAQTLATHAAPGCHLVQALRAGGLEALNLIRPRRALVGCGSTPPCERA